MIRRILLILLALGAAFAAAQAEPKPEEAWRLPLVVLLWVLTAGGVAPLPASIRLRRYLAAPLHGLRARPILNWLVVLVYVVGALLLWLLPYQPTNGRVLLPIEFEYLCAALWGFIFLTTYDVTEPELRASGARLGKSKLTGVMVTLTTLLIILIGAEAYLRVFYITTDGYNFTPMSYWWYVNYGWANPNSLGFRDHEPMPDAPGLTRVAIVGDSFVMGQGINNVDDTFPQRLERELGAGYDVNVIAKSGWDSDIEMYQLDIYPLRPNIVVLSYYLNDIDYLMSDPARNPDTRNFMLPQSDTVAWATRSFFTVAYVYYNLLQYTSVARNAAFAYDLIGAHMDQAMWDIQVQRLYEMVAWSRDHNARLIVLVWPQLLEVDASTPATSRVADFFRSQGTQVVDMTDLLRGIPSSAITVNRFDAHPGIEAHRIAADALYQAILNPQTPEPPPQAMPESTLESTADVGSGS